MNWYCTLTLISISDTNNRRMSTQLQKSEIDQVRQELPFLFECFDSCNYSRLIDTVVDDTKIETVKLWYMHCFCFCFRYRLGQWISSFVTFRLPAAQCQSSTQSSTASRIISISVIHDENMLLQYPGLEFPWYPKIHSFFFVYPEMVVRFWRRWHCGPSFNKFISRLTIDQCFHFLIRINECFNCFSFVKHKLWLLTNVILGDPSENFTFATPVLNCSSEHVFTF